MTRYCPECGELIEEGHNFCKNCGYSFYQTSSYSNPSIKHSGWGIGALVLGIVSMCLIWVNFWFLAYLFIELPMAIIATILGGVGYWGKWKDKFGLAGFILGLLVIIIGAVFSIIIPLIMWGRI